MFRFTQLVLVLGLSACATSPQGQRVSGGESTRTANPAANKAAAANPEKSAAPSGGLLSSIGSLSVGGSGSSSTENKVGAALDLVKAASVSDADLKNVSLQMRQREDKKRQVAGASNKHAQRLERLTSAFKNEDGLQLNFKVYLSNDVNANASPDGSVRVYSGLMDKTTDGELLGVLGHEIGHIKLQHSLNAMRTAYAASAARKVASSSGGALGAIAESDLGALAESVLNAQHSQSQEAAADDYGLAFLKKHGFDQKAMETAFRKLGNSGGGLLSSHPNSAERAERMRQKRGGS